MKVFIYVILSLLFITVTTEALGQLLDVSNHSPPLTESCLHYASNDQAVINDPTIVYYEGSTRITEAWTNYVLPSNFVNMRGYYARPYELTTPAVVYHPHGYVIYQPVLPNIRYNFNRVYHLRL